MRKASRAIRFTRLRSVESGTRRLVTATPKRDTPGRPATTWRMASRPRCLRGLRRTGPKEPRSAKRCRREYPSFRALRGMGKLDRDALAALGPTRIDDRAAAGRLHPHAEPVGLLAVGGGRLEGAFHGE